MNKKILFWCSVFFIILIGFESCNSISKKTARQEEMEFDLKQCNRVLAGVYDSVFIVSDTASSYISTPMAVFYNNNYQHSLSVEFKLREVFYDIYENKKIHSYIQNKHYIKALFFQGKKVPFSTYEMDYEILIQIDADTFRYRYITPQNFDMLETDDGIDMEPRFFWHIYKDEPAACDFIAEQMLKKGFLYTHFTRPTYFYWLNNIIEKHNTPKSKELFCKAYEYLSLTNSTMDIEKEIFERLRTYNCPQVEEIIPRFKTRLEIEKDARK